MLKLIKGSDRAALTQYAFEHIKRFSGKGEKDWILIVPEQFSFEAERMLCLVGGNTMGRYAEVLSFSRLSDRVAAKQGGICGEYLDNGGRLLVMALAAEQVSSRIKLFASSIRKPEFLTQMLSMIGEFRSYCLEPDDLLRAAAAAEGQFAQKLEEFGILYEAYLAVCANGKADPSDRLLRLMRSVEECAWIREKRFYIDGFSDYTGVELRVIELLMQNAAEVIISLPTGTGSASIYKAVDETEKSLKLLAQKYGILCEEEKCTDRIPREKSLQVFLERLAAYATTEVCDSEALQLVGCAAVEEECRAAAMQAARLMMQGVRCRDISVACADLLRYEIPLKHAFEAAGISAYFAGERQLLTKPVVTGLVNCLFAAAGPLEYEDAALYLKSGFCPATEEQRDRLDNYAYLWNIRGSQWSSQWKLHPAGFGEQMTEEAAEYMKQLNEEKEYAMKPLLELRRGLEAAQDTAAMIRAAYAFMEQVGLRERLEEKAAEYANAGQGQAAQELSQIYEILIQSLEQMWLTLGSTVRSPDDFCRLYQTLLTQYEVATIPAALDQVHISDVPDLRYRRTKHLIVLGAADGSFPSYKTADGLLTEDERRVLAAQGLPVAPGRADRLDQEMGRIFSALAAATQTLCLMYSGDEPAWLFRRASILSPGSVCSFSEMPVLNVTELAAKRVREGDTSPCSVLQLEHAENALNALCSYSFEPLERETVKQLYGTQLSLSPSKIDKFAACSFGYFMTYGLKAKPRKQAKLDQPAFGTFVHAVLEHTVNRVKEQGGFPEIPEEELLEIAAEEISRYAELCFPEQAKREEYLFHRSIDEIKEIVLDLWEELRHSAFQPEFCELRFADDDVLPAVQVCGTDAVCKVIGMVDRVDVFRKDEKTYVRVVDYKTGFKEFDYTDILNGAGLQMLIYLFALKNFGAQLLGSDDIEPAGVLYLPAKKAYPLTEPMPEDSVVAEKHRELRRRKGLIRAEQELLEAMEEDPDRPLFMPYKVGKNGIRGDLADKRQMEMLERHVTRVIGRIADQIAAGTVEPNPIVRGQYGSCKYCDYKAVCHEDLGMHKVRFMAETNAKRFWEQLEQEETRHG